MTDNDYTHTCQVCKTEFPATINKDGSVRKRRYLVCSSRCYAIATGRRRPDTPPGTRSPEGATVTKACRHCGDMLRPMPPGEARRRTYCSKACSSMSQADRSRAARRAECRYCAQPFIRKGGSRFFCSNACANTFSAVGFCLKVRAEVDALTRIKVRADAPRAQRKLKIGAEVAALVRIRRNVLKRSSACLGCGESHIRRRPYSRMCSAECETESRQKAKEAYKQTEAYKKSRRAAKSRRRARIRGADTADKIDPIEVFENAKWICHICGDKTLKSKRGTHHDRAPELEHIVALADGGTHTWGNVACSCKKCNQEKGATSFGQIGLGFAM